MRRIPLGARGSFTLLVGLEHLASNCKDPVLPPVLATPVMIMAMENAALAALKPFLDDDETAVGTHIDIRHLAPTPRGMLVIAEACVTRIDDRRIEFRVSAVDEGGQIGSGTHERIVLPVGRMNRYAAMKLAGNTLLSDARASAAHVANDSGP